MFFNELHKLSSLEQSALKKRYGADVMVNLHSYTKKGVARVFINDKIRATVQTMWDDTVRISEVK